MDRGCAVGKIIGSVVVIVFLVSEGASGQGSAVRSAQPTVEQVAVSQSCANALDYVDPTYGGKIRQLKKPDGHEHNIYYHRNPWNADSTYMIGIYSDLEHKQWQVVLYHSKGCVPKELFTLDKYDWRLVWDRNNPAILYTWRESNLYKYDVTTGKAELLKSFRPFGVGVSGPSLNQAGDRILVITSDGTFRSYRLPDMQDERTFKVSFPAGCQTDSRDERYIGYRNFIVTGCNTSDLTKKVTYIYDDRGVLHHRFDGFTFGHTDFSPDGQWAYFKMPGGPRGGPRTPLEIRVVNIDGTNDRVVYSVPASEAVYVQNLHVSWPDRVSTWFIASFFPSASHLPATYARPLDEILQINMSGTYRFLARTETQITDRRGGFWAQPLASPSSDGKRISFNSNRSGTVDLCILFVD